MGTMLAAQAEQVLRKLVQEAAWLASQDLPYLASLTLGLYNGDCAAETAEARERVSLVFLDYSRYLTDRTARQPDLGMTPDHAWRPGPVAPDPWAAIDQLRCPKGFRCLETCEADRCRAADFGVDLCLQCLEPRESPCPFRVSYQHTNFCECPLRLYLTRRTAATPRDPVRPPQPSAL